MPELAKFARQRLSQNQGPETHPDACMLTGFLENALPPRLRTEVTEHLGYCSACRGVLRLALPQQQPEVAPQLVVEKNRPQVWSILRWASVVATTAVVAGTVWLAQVPQANLGSSKSLGNAKTASATAPAKPPLAQPESSSSTNIVAAVKPPVRKHHAEAAPAEVASAKSPEIVPSMEMIQTGIDINKNTSADGKYDPREAMAVAPASQPRPDVSTKRWMINPATGLVYQSSDGLRWQSVNIHRGTAFSTVSSAGNVVWAGGKQGSLYRSADSGKTWEQVKPWGSLEVSADVETIEFRDPQNGSVKTSSGATWLTSDGGDTWKKR